MHTAKVLWQSMLWRGLYYVSAFIINILIARHFEASLSGAVYYLSSIYALILLISSVSLESGIIYFAAKKGVPVERLFSFSMLWSLVVGLLTFLTVYCFFYESYRQISAGLMLFSAVFYVCGNLLITYCAGFFYARNDIKIPNLIIISGTVLLIILIPYSGHSLIPTITDENYFYIYFGSFLVQGLCMALAAKLKYVKGPVLQFLSVVQFKMLLRYCCLAFTGNLIFFLLYRVDYFFVEFYCSAEALGNYIQVSKLVHLFFIWPTILASAVFPLTAGGQKTEIKKLLTLLSRTIFFFYIIVCGALAVFGKWLFPFVFGESFTLMYQPFLLLIPGILALSGIFTLTAYFAGTNRIRLNIYGSLIALGVVLIGDLLFIPAYGITAAALVSSAGYIAYQVYVITVFKKEYRSSVADFFIFKKSDFDLIMKSISTILKRTHESKQ